MSVLSALGSGGALPGAVAGERVARMLDAQQHPDPAAGSGIWTATHIALGVRTLEWERTLHGASAAHAADGPYAVVADATLYHRADLRRALGSAAPTTRPDDAAMLILATYARWGAEGFARLEGDFACILWDAEAGRLVAARSWAGHRTLHHVHSGETLLLASAVRGLLADPAVPRAVDLGAVTSAAAGLWGHPSATAYAGVHELVAGHLLTWTPGRLPSLQAFWQPPTHVMTRRQPLAEAAEELRTLLVDAVRERLAPTGPTGLTLSGGWDSTAVGGAAHVALDGARDRRLQPISISYPVGDPGREDEFIEAVAAQWGVTTSWIDVDELSLFAPPVEDAAARDLPFAHTYEGWNRGLSARARTCGIRVVLDGVGGDQLFQVSSVYLADLFARGEWWELARQWRARGHGGLRGLWREAVHPGLPPVLQAWLARMRGRGAPRGPLHRDPPFWMVGRFLTAHGVLAREAAAAPQLPQGDRVLAETHAYLRFPFFARVVAHLRRFAREEGVELRSPLLDDRVMRFAAARPWSERADRYETKILLRRAMAGLVPPAVLAPRTHRTGITSAYFLRQMRGAGRPLVEAMLADPLLARIGMVDQARLQHAWAHLQRHDDDELAGRLFFTLQADRWLRAHGGAAPE